MQEAENHLNTVSRAIDTSLSNFSQTLDAGEETRLFEKLKQDLNQLSQLKNRIIKLSQNNDDVEADKIANSEYKDLFFNIQKLGRIDLQNQ